MLDENIPARGAFFELEKYIRNFSEMLLAMRKSQDLAQRLDLDCSTHI